MVICSIRLKKYSWLADKVVFQHIETKIAKVNCEYFLCDICLNLTRNSQTTNVYICPSVLYKMEMNLYKTQLHN